MGDGTKSILCVSLKQENTFFFVKSLGENFFSQKHNGSRCDGALWADEGITKSLGFQWRPGGNQSKEEGKRIRTNQNEMLIFGHQGTKGLKTT